MKFYSNFNVYFLIINEILRHVRECVDFSSNFEIFEVILEDLKIIKW